MSAAVVLLVEVRYRAIYRCGECGTKALGDAEYLLKQLGGVASRSTPAGASKALAYA